MPCRPLNTLSNRKYPSLPCFPRWLRRSIALLDHRQLLSLLLFSLSSFLTTLFTASPYASPLVRSVRPLFPRDNRPGIAHFPCFLYSDPFKPSRSLSQPQFSWPFSTWQSFGYVSLLSRSPTVFGDAELSYVKGTEHLPSYPRQHPDRWGKHEFYRFRTRTGSYPSFTQALGTVVLINFLLV
jgi:hypothetical protein